MTSETPVRSGGEYVYLTERYGPAWGFINGWVSFTAGFVMDDAYLTKARSKSSMGC